jgi:hypothetical protein
MSAPTSAPTSALIAAAAPAIAAALEEFERLGAACPPPEPGDDIETVDAAERLQIHLQLLTKTFVTQRWPRGGKLGTMMDAVAAAYGGAMLAVCNAFADGAGTKRADVFDAMLDGIEGYAIGRQQAIDRGHVLVGGIMATVTPDGGLAPHTPDFRDRLGADHG